MIVDGIHIPVTRVWLNDVLEKRIKEMKLKIEDLFLITRCVSRDVEGDSVIETEYGKIRVFFRADLPDNKLAYILHKSKFDFPKKNVRFQPNILGGGGTVTTEEEGRNKNHVN